MYMIVLLILICVGFCLLECLADRFPNAQKQIFFLAFITVTVLCTARYAYGRDILHYIPFYQHLTGSYSYNVSNDLIQFEPGFVIFCTLCKRFHLTFWMMTAVISIFYWGAIYWLFTLIKKYRTFALMILVVLDHALFLEQLRQCLAVALIIYAFCCYYRLGWKWIPIVLLLLSITMHKTALPFLFFMAAGWFTYGLELESRAYFLLAVLLVSFMIFAVHPLFNLLTSYLPSAIQTSAEYHLLVGKRFQKIFIVYMMAIVCLGYYTMPTDASKREKVFNWLVWIMLLLIVVLYQYYLILYRLRSYILPFALFWGANMIAQSANKLALPRQAFALAMLLFAAKFTYDQPHEYEHSKGKTDRLSWVWERQYHTEWELQNRQLEQAKLFWKYDNDRGIQLGFR